MKNLFLILAILWAISTTSATLLILYNTKIRTSCIGDNLTVGNLLINQNTHEIIYVNEDIVQYFNNGDLNIDNQAILHEGVKSTPTPDYKAWYDTELSDPVLRWASRLQKLMRKRLE